MTGKASGWGVLRDRHFSPFRVMLLREARLALVLNPKVGSTFLRELLTEAMTGPLGHDDPSDGRYRILHMARAMPVAPIRDYLDFFRAPDAWAIHSIVRNPYARAVSAWRDKFHDGHVATPDGARAGYPRSIRGKVLDAVRAHARTRGLPGGEEGTMVPFGTFVDYVDSEPEGRRNSHWELQRRVILHDRLPYTGVMRLEDGLAEPLARLLAPLGLDPDWVRARAGRPANTSSKSRDPVIDEGLAARLHALYAADFEAFGYDPDSWRGR